MELYLVTIDTTFANSLGKSLQNYGFVLASDANMARERFVMPLKSSVQPQILAGLFAYTYAYKLSEITENVSEDIPIWTYVSNNPKRKKGQQVKTPYFSDVFKTEEIIEPSKEMTKPVEVIEEFKAPEGITDPTVLALLKSNFDMMKELKNLKSNPQVQPKESAKKIVAELEGAFRAPPPLRTEIPGTPGLDPRNIPIPQVNGVTSLPKGKIDRTTLERLKQNISHSNFEVID
jgi:hypothetical protein